MGVQPDGDGDLLSTGAIVGVAIGSGIAAFLLAFLLPCWPSNIDPSENAFLKKHFKGQYTPGGVGGLAWLIYNTGIALLDCVIVAVAVGLILGLCPQSVVEIVLVSVLPPVIIPVISSIPWIFWVWNQDWED
ncbi:hypothetical protein Pelo_16099 [Pelomyxa schiedti]|nr:hypothetical protein Pelo_16099 [Pelomyxa schiedti]